MVHPTTNKGTCEFETQTDSIIRDQIVASCLSNKLRRKLLQVSNISLEDTLKIGRSLETAYLQATAIEDNESQETIRNDTKGRPRNQNGLSEGANKRELPATAVPNRAIVHARKLAIYLVLSGLPGVKWIHDDVTVYGKTVREHNQRLAACLQRLEQYNVTLNREKCVFGVDAVSFMAMRLSQKGIQPSSQKVEAVKAFKTPRTVTEVKSFLGLLSCDPCKASICHFDAILASSPDTFDLKATFAGYES